MARVDALTELYNRRHLDEQLHRLGVDRPGATSGRWRSCCSTSTTSSRSTTRSAITAATWCCSTAPSACSPPRASGDVVGRWGGEEFLLVLPNTGLDEAAHAAERMRASVAEAPITIDAHGTGRDDERRLRRRLLGNVDALLSRADAALYRSKSEGRNRISTSPSGDAMTLDDRTDRRRRTPTVGAAITTIGPAARGPFRPEQLITARARQDGRLAAHAFRLVDLISISIIVGGRRDRRGSRRGA